MSHSCPTELISMKKRSGYSHDVEAKIEAARCFDMNQSSNTGKKSHVLPLPVTGPCEDSWQKFSANVIQSQMKKEKKNLKNKIVCVCLNICIDR